MLFICNRLSKNPKIMSKSFFGFLFFFFLMLFLKMMMAKRRKILTFHLWLNDLVMDEMFLGPFVYGNSVEQIVKSGTRFTNRGRMG